MTITPALLGNLLEDPVAGPFNIDGTHIRSDLPEVIATGEDRSV